MNKWLTGLVASLACLLLLLAALTVMVAVMDAVSYSPAHLFKLLLAPPLAFGGWLLLRWMDRKPKR